MLTEKENYLRTIRGEMPEWIPIYCSDITRPGMGTPAFVGCGPSFLNDFRMPGGSGVDIWGVPYVTNSESAGGMLPKPGYILLRDITKWRDVIKAPDISGFDWEKIAKAELKKLEDMGIDRTQTAVSMNLYMGPFQTLMAFMGFTEGLCAMIEEPEEVMELFDYVSEFYFEVAKNFMPYIKPDIVGLADDTAAWAGSFVSPEMYHDMLVPAYDKIAKLGRDNGLPVAIHNCGKSGGHMEDWKNLGIRLWEPAQCCNDIAKLKEENEWLSIAGGWQPMGELLDPDITYDQIYESIYEATCRLAPGGRYMFCSNYLGTKGDPEYDRKTRIVMDIYRELGHKFYK